MRIGLLPTHLAALRNGQHYALSAMMTSSDVSLAVRQRRPGATSCEWSTVRKFAAEWLRMRLSVVEAPS